MRDAAAAALVPPNRMHWSVAEIASAIGGAVLAGRPDLVLTSVTTDSRQVAPAAVFFALRGAHYDGHEFVAVAAQAGAAAAVVERPVEAPVAQVRVADTTRALGDLARWTRSRQALRVIAVTGSNGKTTTKEMIAAVCAAAQFPAPRHRILKSEGNENNHIGLPRTLLRLQGDEAVAVLEMGMNHPGEIARLTEIAQPDYAVITNIGSAHLEAFGGSMAGVAAAKTELFAGLAPGAVMAVNLDDEWLRRLAPRFPNRTVTFGAEGDVRARAVADLNFDGIAFDLQIGADTARVRLRLIGRHNVSNALAAAAIGHAMGLRCEAIAAGLERTVATAMRMQIARLGNGVTLINDTYNANPSSAEAALMALRRFSGRPVVVLGEMRELGDEARRAHRFIGERAAALGVHALIMLGTYAEDMAAGARAGGLAATALQVCGSHAEAAAAVTARWQPGDVVLIKGSRSMKMEEVVRLLEEAGGGRS